MPVSRRAAVRLLLFLRVQHSRRYFFTLQRNFPRCWSKRHRCDLGTSRKNRAHLRSHPDLGARRACRASRPRNESAAGHSAYGSGG